MFSGECLKRVAVLIAVMICRVTQSSAKERNDVSLSCAEVAHRLVEADQPLLDEILAVAAGEEVRARLQPDEAGVAADEVIHRRVVAVARLDDELQILELALRLLLSAGCWGWTGGGHMPGGLRGRLLQSDPVN